MQLLRAVGVNHCQLMQILAPWQGQLPHTDAQFEVMTHRLRRMGHIFEHAPGNLATALHQRLGARSTMLASESPAQGWLNGAGWGEQGPLSAPTDENNNAWSALMINTSTRQTEGTPVSIHTQPQFNASHHSHTAGNFGAAPSGNTNQQAAPVYATQQSDWMTDVGGGFS